MIPFIQVKYMTNYLIQHKSTQRCLQTLALITYKYYTLQTCYDIVFYDFLRVHITSNDFVLKIIHNLSRTSCGLTFYWPLHPFYVHLYSLVCGIQRNIYGDVIALYVLCAHE